MTNRELLQNKSFIRKKQSVYTPEQVRNWLERLKWPQFGASIPEGLSQGKFQTTLGNLTALVRCHAVAFVYENTEMHYSKNHSMVIDPQDLYQRLVVDRRGSHCIGLNVLFLWMLRGLGYRAYAGLGRVNETGDAKGPLNYTGLSHMVIFVQPGDDSKITYIVDVGCGGSGPTTPILLSDAEDNVVMGTTPTERHRLRKGSHPESTIGGDCWILEVLHEKPDQGTAEVAWRTVYMFSEQEAFQNDFVYANRSCYTQETGFFADQIICSAHIWFEEDEKKNVDFAERRLVRIGLMGRLLKRFVGSSAEFINLVHTEEERADVLRQYFGIDLSSRELEYIRGRRAGI